MKLLHSFKVFNTWFYICFTCSWLCWVQKIFFLGCFEYQVCGTYNREYCNLKYISKITDCLKLEFGSKLACTITAMSGFRFHLNIFLSLAGFLCVASAILGFVQRLVGRGSTIYSIVRSCVTFQVCSIDVYVCRNQKENIIDITLVRMVWRLLWWKVLNIEHKWWFHYIEISIINSMQLENSVATI